MRIRWLINIVAVILIVLAVGRQELPSGPHGSFDPLLARRVPAIHLSGSFAEAAAELERLSGVKIVIDTSTRDLVDTQVTLDCIPSTLDHDLHAALSVADQGALTLLVRNGQIQVIAPSKGPQTMRVYDVRDLYARLVEECPPDNGAYLPFPGAVLYAPPVATSIVPPTRQQIAEKQAEDTVEWFVTSHVFPDQWSINGGTVPAPIISHGWMVVVQTADGHDQLTRLLYQLRQASRTNSLSTPPSP